VISLPAAEGACEARAKSANEQCDKGPQKRMRQSLPRFLCRRKGIRVDVRNASVRGRRIQTSSGAHQLVEIGLILSGKPTMLERGSQDGGNLAMRSRESTK